MYTRSTWQPRTISEASVRIIKAYSCIARLLPLQLEMAICYRYKSALIFPVPYADNQLLCSLCNSAAARSGVTPLILRASNTRFSSRWSNFCTFTPRIHQKQSQVRNLLGGAPPFQNSRSTTALPDQLSNTTHKTTRSRYVTVSLHTVPCVLTDSHV